MMQYLWIIFLGLAAIIGFLNDVTDLSKKGAFNKIQLSKGKDDGNLNFNDYIHEKPVLDNSKSEKIYNEYCEREKIDNFCKYN
jgi:hypothetical protein